jgi:hypothetical protein
LTDHEVVPLRQATPTTQQPGPISAPNSDSMPLRKRLASMLLDLVIDWRKA